MNKIIFIVLLLFLTLCSVFAQVSASQYFEGIYLKYQDIQDMQANIVLNIKGLRHTGTLAYKFPDKFIINLHSSNQVFVSDGQNLIVYSPSLSTTFIQNLGLGGGSGLMKVLNNEYSVSYTDNSPDLGPLDEVSSENIKKLTFSRKLYKGSATINKFVIAFKTDGTIRRLLAYPTSGDKEILIDFSSVKFNSNMSDSSFKYEVPKSSSRVENFLYDITTK